MAVVFHPYAGRCAAGFWWRVEGKIDAAKADAIRAAEAAERDATLRADGALQIASLTATQLAE